MAAAAIQSHKLSGLKMSSLWNNTGDHQEEEMEQVVKRRHNHALLLWPPHLSVMVCLENNWIIWWTQKCTVNSWRHFWASQQCQWLYCSFRGNRLNCGSDKYSGAVCLILMSEKFLLYLRAVKESTSSSASITYFGHANISSMSDRYVIFHSNYLSLLEN